ncbi:MAG: 50S ribosomal protein L18 [Chloroflexota bacterium]|nr:50S ribosomal protein L18 [Chloroflexota bacterium]
MFKRPDTRGARIKRHRRIRRTLSGTAQRPRLAVFRSLAHIYGQIIDDTSGRTLVHVTDIQPALREVRGTKTERAKQVGQALAARAKEKGIRAVVFDRGGFLYHGRVKALADGAREGGLEF